MTDYDKDTGSSGTMRIRDTGTVVEFWINSGNSSTFAHELPWAYVVNGTTSSWREYDYKAGAGWEKLGSWNVTSSQTVTFKLGDTGTSGFGGPTTFSKYIDRASNPDRPSTPTITNITGTSFYVTFTDGDNNGDAIDGRHLAVNTSGTVSGARIVASDRSTTVDGLQRGTTYWVWAQTHNSYGWSPWSYSKTAKTLDVPETPDPVVITDVKQTSVHINFTGNGNGGSTVLEWAMYYNDVNNPNTATKVPWVTGGVTVTGLDAGKTYYFWSRGRNSVGWSPYSAVRSAKLKAGAYVNVGGVWKPAVPWVNVEGVWKVARSWTKVAGTWRETL